MQEQNASGGLVAVIMRIEGNVQGVGFRNWMQRLAGQLALTGWVRNRRDGSVEAMVCGPRTSVDEAVARAKVGPRSAKVTAVAVAAAEPESAAQGFEVLPGV